MNITTNLKKMVWVVTLPDMPAPLPPKKYTQYLTVPYLPAPTADAVMSVMSVTPRPSLCVFTDLAEATLFSDTEAGRGDVALVPSDSLCARMVGGECDAASAAKVKSMSLARAIRTASTLGVDIVVASDSSLDSEAELMILRLEHHPVMQQPTIEPLHLLGVCWDQPPYPREGWD